MSQESLKISGTVSQRSYRSIGKYMLSPLYKILFVTAIVLADLAFVWLVISQKDLVWLAFPLMLSLGGVAFYRWNNRNVINRVIACTPAIRDGKSFDLDISFDADAVRVHNRATGLDTALSYELFSSYAVTEDVTALFVKTGTYLLVPVSNMSKEKQQEMLLLLKERCGHLPLRRF